MKLTKLGQSLGSAIDFLARKMVWLSAAAVLAVFGLVVVDVVGRYFFNHPVKGSNDIGEVILVLIAYLAMAYHATEQGARPGHADLGQAIAQGAAHSGRHLLPVRCGGVWR